MGSYTSKIHNDYIGTMHYPQIFTDFLITKIVGFCSFVPCLAIFITYFFVKKKTFQDGVAFQLSIACMIHSISFLFPLIYDPIDTKEDADCRFQGTLMTTFDLTSLSLTTSISYLAYRSFTEAIESERGEKLKKIISFGVGWILPIIFGIFCISLGDNHSGINLICFPRNMAIMIIFLIISIVFFVGNMICVILLTVAVKRDLDKIGHKQKIKAVLQCLSYFLTQAITYGPFIFDVCLKLKNRIKDEKPSRDKKFHFGWEYFKDFTQCGTGLVFSFVYGFSENILNRLKSFFPCFKTEDKEVYDDSNGSDSGEENNKKKEETEKKDDIGMDILGNDDSLVLD